MAAKPAPKFNAKLSASYARNWASATIDPDHMASVSAAAKRILANRTRYEGVEKLTGVPWYFVGVAHNLEASCNFNKHLHNGDPLKAKTVRVPAGRPLTPGPWTWEESAADALTLKGLNKLKPSDWTIERVLFELERFNGFGYMLYHPATDSPYLWSMTNHADPGKYIEDGKWSATAVSQQVGAVAALLQIDITTPDVAFVDAKTPIAEVAKDKGVLAMAGAGLVYVGSVATSLLQPVADAAGAVVNAVPHVVTAAREPINGVSEVTGWLGLNTLPAVGGYMTLALLTVAAVQYFRGVR